MKSETRNADQITSKWRDFRLKCTEFGGIYNNLLNIRKCGSNNFDVFKAAMDQFEKNNSNTQKFSVYEIVYENLENESGRPRWRRLGAFSRDERVVM
uniref:Uncharacterized protein n=1 Tax=Lactuca sativa TaxID=4236 RepID=A0A9R1VQW5_LACSA|nr:hypothetical protein LSAT_V11C400227820 [Lactuca sativa]